jgi:YbdK family carboxylate-amine ligase
MGEAVTDPLAALDEARRHFAESTDFTVAIEEEFQILDAVGLGLVNRYGELRDRADASALAGNVAGELISSEIEVKTGRCESFDEAARRLREHRRILVDLADELDLAVCTSGTHPFSPWWEQEIIDTPHYRLVEGRLRYVAWRNNTFGIHVHVGVRDADRAMAVCGALRSVLPELLAVSASSPWLEGRHTHLRSTRTQIFTRTFPRCGVPDVFASWEQYDRFVRFLPGDRLHPRAHRDLVERAAASGLRDGRDPDLRRASRREPRDRRGGAAARPGRALRRGVRRPASRCLPTLAATSRRTSGGASAGGRRAS